MKWGLFDVDCREMMLDHSLDFRPRVRPMGEKLNKIYELIQQNDAVLLFTTCCSGAMLQPDSRKDVLFVPMDEKMSSWQEQFSSYKQFYLEKKKSSPDLACLETFSYNKNATLLLDMLEVDEWIVFGNGLDLCVNHAMQHLLATKRPVTFLSDVMISSAKGHGNSGTDENRDITFANWCAMGAVQETLENFLARISDSKR